MIFNFYCIKTRPLFQLIHVHIMLPQSQFIYLDQKQRKTFSQKYNFFSGNSLQHPVMEREASAHYYREPKGKSEQKKPNSKDHLSAKMVPAEVLKPQFILQCGLRGDSFSEIIWLQIITNIFQNPLTPSKGFLQI